MDRNHPAIRMFYMLYREPESIRRQVLFMKERGCRVAPCIQAGLIFRKDDGFTPAVFEAAIRNALFPPSDGINLYTWKILHASPDLARQPFALWRGQPEG